LNEYLNHHSVWVFLEKARSFGFSAFGICVSAKPNVLERAEGFFTMRHNSFVNKVYSNYSKHG